MDRHGSRGCLKGTGKITLSLSLQYRYAERGDARSIAGDAAGLEGGIALRQRRAVHPPCISRVEL
ncbi:hypothetical protein SPHINGO391_480044 [Sphingomonas aurantiaca]|uniref:Uncharacterized protein n=1 Tax=Sphingomonas aurantiaca TaxID=185949 RepID=A0A5E7ZZ54_9SPHN|nr:hypothetical protein SPHINGO391_480044 [Sphingomonas aurantiaca]